ncbi:MAG TPA: AraC family transcriptional regulator [Chitinophaga sp.]|uniref:helix-turn-helix transcriptional regulator n=1 Tax=Chitinophaga sp. TaxID=1869181 RepID=UPI002C87AB48|nr:AraC family transcriptional regulator [Chitinophaga sp.]HVI46950.1 AraC family transcriptional regulator [Chitinophaga sp.]
MYTLYNSFDLEGQHHIKTWEQQGQDWAAYSRYREQAAHRLYVPHTILNLVVSGEKRMYDGVRVHHLRAGDVFLIPAGSLLCSEILRPSDSYGSINLVLPAAMIDYNVKKQSNTQSQPTLTLQLPAASHWRRFSTKLLERFQHGGQEAPGYYETLEEAVSLLGRHAEAINLLYATTRYHPQELLGELYPHLHEVRLLEDVALVGHMSTATLKRRFKQLYNTSPMHWIWGKRLEMAAFLLRTTIQPIPEIAYGCGFEDVTHFYRLFRRYFHITPLQWRNAKTDLFSK